MSKDILGGTASNNLLFKQNTYVIPDGSHKQVEKLVSKDYSHDASIIESSQTIIQNPRAPIIHTPCKMEANTYILHQN